MDYFFNLFSYENKNMSQCNEIKFYIHDKEHTVGIKDLSADTTLNKYLREKLFLTGTKLMCQEGGCGCCIVTTTTKHPFTNKEITFAINSCLVSILSCQGWKISTVEGIGNPNIGYHKIQKTLVQFNGTQCGFCSSGMVMNMYELLEKGKPTMKQVENSFGGNICRCTGYRPILTAFKSLCADADPEIIGKHPYISDIEDLNLCTPSLECKKECVKMSQTNNALFYFNLGANKWFKVFSIDDIITIFFKFPESSYMLVSGNTSKGVYRINKAFELYIDITYIRDLLGHEINDNNLVLGANMNLTDVMRLFYKTGKENENFSYLTKLADHIDLIANVPVRNIGSLAGNLSIKNQHNEFPSDIYLIFATVGATLTIVGSDKKDVKINMVDYLKYNMNKKILKNITLPPLKDYKYESYKIMPRAQNAHALVNAGFLLQLDNNNVKSINIVYGCINPTFVHAENTEKYLVGKNIFDNTTLQEAFKTLDGEIQPDYILPDPTPEFRKQLAISLFYKFILSIAPDNKISPQNKSGGQKQTRPMSKGVQDYKTNESLYPLTQPIMKLEANAQVSGQAEYIFDMPDRPGQLFAAFVVAKSKPNSVIQKIDKTKAMKMAGVVAYFDKNDIPGENSFMPGMFPLKEELFCSGTVKYYYQPIGIVVATSQEIAEEASELVEVKYMLPNVEPLITIREILNAKAEKKIVKEKEIKAETKGDDVKHVIKGSFDIGMQYHYHMENQCCNVVPVEDGLDIFPSAQGMDVIQSAIAANLKIDANKINISIRRLGGAYGAKISRNGMISCSAALAAYKLQKPVKMWLPFITNMNVVGKRCPLSANYEVGVNNSGVVQYLNSEIYSDYGIGGNDPMIDIIITMLYNGYKHDTFNVTAYHTNSDTHANTWCRAPGTTECLGLIESIMDHISYSIGMDPLELRLANLNKAEHEKLFNFINDLKIWADTTNRLGDIKKFNQINKWVKRGLSVVPMAYSLEYFGSWKVIISIYQADGSISIAHGGVEMGQGINTKAAQVCAYAFGIPVDKVSIKPTNNLNSPNAFASGGSVTSEAVCYGILQAAEILQDRMRPIKDTMKNPTWVELVQKCTSKNVDLSAGYMFNPLEVHNYYIYGVCATEVEVDLLTGNHQILRVDLLEDTGESMSPEIDIGQVEGAFIMGQGFWTTEQIIYSKKGELLTNRTWTYKPPGAKDIPIDFRVKFPENNPNPLGVLKSKATGEPPMCMACSIPLAIRNAVASARESAKGDRWYPFDGPSTVENTFLNTLHDYKQYVL